jgi:hypothetical protein
LKISEMQGKLIGSFWMPKIKNKEIKNGQKFVPQSGQWRTGVTSPVVGADGAATGGPGLC